jgi:hypothetical protein
MKKPVPVHPPLIAAYMVLSLYAANMALVPYRDVVLPLLTIVAITSGVWALASLLLRDAHRGAAVASVAAAGFFLFGPVGDALGVASGPGRALWFLPLWSAFWIALMLGCAFLKKPRFALTKGLNAVGAALVILAGASIALGAKDLTAVAGAPVDGPAGAAKARQPDIVYVILDGYGRQDALERYFDFDNRPFLQELEQRGFTIIPEAITNYNQTQLSLASSLNMAYVQDLVENRGTSDAIRSQLNALVDRSAVVERLRKRGYRYFAITTGFPALQFESADLVLTERTGTLFQSALIDRTPLRGSSYVAASLYDERRHELVEGLELLGALGEPGPTPRFTVVHILAPHPPFVFGAHGEELRPAMPFGLFDGSHFYEAGGTKEQYLNGYRGQIQWLNQKLLAVLDELVKNRENPPVVILQADHGPKMHLHQEAAEETELDEAYPIFLAVNAPGTAVADVRTPVNLFRALFSDLFQEELPMLPDRAFYSPWSEPLNFTEVTDQLLSSDGDAVVTSTKRE